MLTLRTAKPEEAGWVNEQYAKAGFIPSDLGRDTVVVAELHGRRAGLGRLVDAGSGAYELGGMYVLEGFRGAGVARAIVEELLRLAGEREVYCIPFANLEELYASAGFRRIEPTGVPSGVAEKLAWCERNIARAVILMKLVTT